MVAPASPPGPLDADRVAAARDAALGEAQRLGCTSTEFRVERIHSQHVRLRDGDLEGAADEEDEAPAAPSAAKGRRGRPAAKKAAK